MRIDDPQMLKAIEQLEACAATFRRLAGFTALGDVETELSKPMRYDCPHCSRMTRTQTDLDEHIHIDHPQEVAA